ncbi:tetratricopeptide repeat protein [Flavobacterium terrigena]|uniref:Tetratricopeptide repeat-containing protein n=1 Tax=Flavobacterium terrigena TaxID=402734 RepID=A0A1H6QG19_9FLAO|nr:LuxR C-terminal-related transcriptional regulator [Flavobacterium terrigena]SEI40796.1 Tetratricopeptide repeat-containing protein [Flavobacterium terrigena]
MFRKLHYCLFLLFFFSVVPAQEGRLEKLIQDAKEKKLTPKNILEIERLTSNSKNDTLNMNAYRFLGETYSELEVYDKANLFLQKALYLAKKNKLNKEIGILIGNLGNLQRHIGNYEKSLELLTESKKHFQKTNNLSELANANANIASLLITTGHEQEAIKILIPIINDKGTKPKKKAILLINVGAIYSKLKKYDIAVNYYLEALSILKFEKNMEKMGMLTYQNLAESFIKMKQYDKALFYNQKSEKMLLNSDSNLLKANLYLLYSEIYEGKLDFKKAYKNHQSHLEYKELSDSAKATLKFENIETLNKLENQKLDLQIKGQKIQLLENEKFATRTKITFLILLIIGILLLSYYLIKKQRSKVKSLSHVIHQTEDKLEFTQTKTDKMVLNIVKNNDFIERFKDNLKQVQKTTSDSESKTELGKLLFELQNFKLINDTKEELFNEVDAQFLYKLEKKFPSLTEEERKICVLIYLNLKNKDMAVILNLSLRSVENSRYRIRKKMDLDSNDNLSTVLQSL